MQAVTFQGLGEVAVQERPEPELLDPTDVVVDVDATAVCGSDLHIYHGRHPVEPGFTIGHEFVGTVAQAGPDVSRVKPGDRVLGCFVTACGDCFFCERRQFHKCVEQRIFGHGKISGDLQGSQAEQVLVPYADMVLRVAPEGLSDDAALFGGDVMGTAFNAVRSVALQEGETAIVLGMGPVGLCAVQAARAAGAAQVLAVDSIPERLEMAKRFGAQPIHLTDDDVRAEVKAATEGRGADACIEAVGHPDALDLAIRSTRSGGRLCAVGVYGKPCEVHMGLLWNKALTLTCGPANVVGCVDDVLALLADGTLDPTPLITHHMPLAEAAEAYAMYDRREALKIVLKP